VLAACLGEAGGGASAALFGDGVVGKMIIVVATVG
jgi:hypothetical protein